MSLRRVCKTSPNIRENDTTTVQGQNDVVLTIAPAPPSIPGDPPTIGCRLHHDSTPFRLPNDVDSTTSQTRLPFSPDRDGQPLLIAAILSSIWHLGWQGDPFHAPFIAIPPGHGTCPSALMHCPFGTTLWCATLRWSRLQLLRSRSPAHSSETTLSRSPAS